MTDKLAGHGAAKRRVMPPVEHRKHQGLNNRAENSHQPTRRRERQVRQFKSTGQAQPFLCPHDGINNLFHHLHSIAEHGRMAWQKASSDTKRASAKADIGRFKQVVGDGLRPRTDGLQATRADVAVPALNCMLKPGRSTSVCTA